MHSILYPYRLQVAFSEYTVGLILFRPGLCFCCCIEKN